MIVVSSIPSFIAFLAALFSLYAVLLYLLYDTYFSCTHVEIPVPIFHKVSRHNTSEWQIIMSQEWHVTVVLLMARMLVLYHKHV